jgi:hypothetical protein
MKRLILVSLMLILSGLTALDNQIMAQSPLTLVKQVRFTFGGSVDTFFDMKYGYNKLWVNGRYFNDPPGTMRAAISAFDLTGEQAWTKTDTGFNAAAWSYSDVNAVAFIGNHIFWIIDDKILVKLNQNSEIIWKKTIGAVFLFITNWADTIVAVEQQNNGNVLLISPEGEIIRSFPMNGNGYGWMTPKVKGDNLYLSSNTATFGAYVAQYDLKTGKQNWRFNTPNNNLYGAFRIMIDLDQNGRVFAWGNKFLDDGRQNFFAYSLSPEGALKWYKEWFPAGDWRLNYGNWARSIAIGQRFLALGGEVERNRAPAPIDANINDAYLALLNPENGELIDEETWHYEDHLYNEPNDRFSVNMGLIWLDNRLIVLGYAGGGIVNIIYWTYGYLRFYDILTSITPEPNSLPTGFFLSQNYPNPFNPSTTIQFALPKASLVMLKIYNVLGQEVATLVNEELKIGAYRVNWDGANVPSGVYFYRLQAGDFVETKKLLLLR